MGYAQLVIAPVGSGKSTYCSNLYRHCETLGRLIHIVNLDPAAENFYYPVAMDIRELISLDDVMEELGLGPNGGLIYCMDYYYGYPDAVMLMHLEENLDDRLTEELDNCLDDDYLVFDSPGWIEPFSHVHMLCNFVKHLKRKNINVCCVYLLDSQLLGSKTSTSAFRIERTDGSRFKKLNKSLIELVDQYRMVSFIPLDLGRKAAYSMYWRADDA